MHTSLQEMTAYDKKVTQKPQLQKVDFALRGTVVFNFSILPLVVCKVKGSSIHQLTFGFCLKVHDFVKAAKYKRVRL